jgi:hypothetical protein
VNAPHPEPDQFVLDAPEASALTLDPEEQRHLESAAKQFRAELRRINPSPNLRPWVERRLRERLDLPLRLRDREQATEQLEDL